MFLVAGNAVWRRATVQCIRFTSREKFGGVLSRELCTTTRRNGPSEQRSPIQLRMLHDDNFRVERKVKHCTRTKKCGHVIF